MSAYWRDVLGRVVREAWVRWAKTQPDPKPSWLVPYDELSEPDKEADRQVAEAVLAHDRSQGKTAFLVRFHGTTEDGRVLPAIEAVVGFDREHYLLPEMVIAIERAILGRNRALGWARVDIHEVRRLGLLLLAEQPD